MLAMEKFVRHAGPEMDAELTRYFYRHVMREEAVMAEPWAAWRMRSCRRLPEACRGARVRSLCTR
jgi:hypothetical protein